MLQSKLLRRVAGLSILILLFLPPLANRCSGQKLPTRTLDSLFERPETFQLPETRGDAMMLIERLVEYRGDRRIAYKWSGFIEEKIGFDRAYLSTSREYVHRWEIRSHQNIALFIINSIFADSVNFRSTYLHDICSRKNLDRFYDIRVMTDAQDVMEPGKWIVWPLNSEADRRFRGAKYKFVNQKNINAAFRGVRRFLSATKSTSPPKNLPSLFGNPCFQFYYRTYPVSQ